ncbi:LysR family transcriptional regulator [Jeotgalibacillus proteolyticus]|uniref:LysR family transcriptional regulator n=1 Tax=Jeotgalibacillus proteolyticus TaxID=2082395 RepID=A0A2S5GDF2_9BACL|nr:LysR family transcriptional regulator [Jeotgalibacillus proteolyticus]PPA70923.1 LysR family transcriptional regulator [Jeotgalibacillus proteolyticus]
MNISWLRTFITAASCENFHKTSEILYLSQPTVTVHIKQLEKELGIPLFIRKGRNVRLTSEGRGFLAHAVSIVDEVEKSQKQIEQLRQGYKNTLTVAVSPLIAATYLPYWVKTFLKEYKETEVIIKVAESDMISGEIERGSADVGLSRMKTNMLGLTCEKLYEEPLVVAAPHDGREPENAYPLELGELIEKEYLLTHNHPEYWEPVLQALKHHYPVIRTMKISQVHVTKRFIEEGIGFSILPRSVVRRELAEGRVLEVFLDRQLKLPSSSTYLVKKDGLKEVDDFIGVVKRLI